MKAKLKQLGVNPDDFSKDQMLQIHKGFEGGLTIEQIKTYAKPEFDWEQMLCICWGFETGLSIDQVKTYAKLEYTWKQMQKIRATLNNQKTNKMKVKMIKWFDDQFYKIIKEDMSEDFISSVTTKLGIFMDRGLIRWRGEVGNEAADRKMYDAAHRGSRIHYAWDVMTRKGCVVYNPPERSEYTEKEIKELKAKYNEVYILQDQYEMFDVCKLKKWHEALNPEVIKSESIVYSLKNRDAGTVDKIIKVKEGDYHLGGSKSVHLKAGIYIVDLKTGKQIGKAWMQLAAYCACYKEMTGEKIAGAMVVHTGSTTKTGIRGLSTHVRFANQLRDDYKDYRAIATVYERTMNEKPRQDEFEAIVTLNESK